MQRRSVPLVTLVALILVAGLLAPAPGPAASATTIEDAVQSERWSAHSFAVRAGQTYIITLTPKNADADLQLYNNVGEVARSLNGSRTEDRVRWTATADGIAVAWIYAPTQDTSYRLTIAAGQPRRVGLQVGHWRRWEAPYPINTNTGASGGGKTEDEVNLAIARAAAAAILKDDGYAVDVLPALIPKGYQADAFVAIHADGGLTSRRGFFADRPARSSTAEAEVRLVRLLNAEYAEVTGIPYQFRSTVNTRYYYGYSRVTPKTPMVLIETGFLTNATDRTVIVDRPDLAAAGIARAIRRFLDEPLRESPHDLHPVEGEVIEEDQMDQVAVMRHRADLPGDLDR